jgi:2-keto-4-pentenoate hydratase/2-oxohepta-3-ene-1,7-dioic acid hydratase in catechol pathway
MKQSRRSFLKTSGLVGAATMTGAAGLAQLPAAAAPQQSSPDPSGPLPREMTFCTLRRGAEYTLGLRTDRGVLDVAAAEHQLREGAPTTITDVLQGRGDASVLRRLATNATTGAPSGKYLIPEQDAQFGPCVTDPEKIVCVGLNYRKHAAEIGEAVPAVPILFNKFNTALNWTGGTIAASKQPAEHFDYEAELVIVMGRVARDVSVSDALKHVFGYCTGNDVTARDLQRRTSQWMLGKTGDGWGPIGPWLVTADQVDPDNLKIACSVNGETRQSSNTSDMVFNCAQLVSYISKHMTLKPGDIIFTGTPQGVIAGYPREKQVWLKPGDRIVTTIEKLGELRFTLT